MKKTFRVKQVVMGDKQIRQCQTALQLTEIRRGMTKVLLSAKMAEYRDVQENPIPARIRTSPSLYSVA